MSLTVKNFVFISFLSALLFISSFSNAETYVPQTKEHITYSFAPIVKKATPSVVNIYTKKLVKKSVRRFSPFFSLNNDPFFQDFFNRSLGGFTKERLENSLGSGVILTKDGYVVTSAHVIAGADEITVILHDGQEYDATLILEEKRTDLAVLKIDTNKETTFPFLKMGDSDEIEVGDLVLAIGNPFGVGQTVTSGIVSANARAHLGISDMNYFIQTDAAINPGNSGGALIGIDGHLIGINTAIFSKSGGSLGIGFAIPVSMVKTVLKAAIKDGVIRRPWFGATTQNITSDMVENLHIKTPKGALVNHVTANSPADKAGIKTGDIITHINGKDIWDSISLKFRIATLELNKEVQASLIRNGEEVMISFTPITAPEIPERHETKLNGDHPLIGVKVANINPALIEEKGLEAVDTTKDKVIILDVKEASYAKRLGLQENDIIQSINNTSIENVKFLEKVLSTSKKSWQFILKRDNQILTISVL